MRLFVAISLPEDWKTILAEPQGKIGWLGRGVKWVEPRGMHLTLRFLGEVSESDLSNVEKGISNACKNTATFPMKLKGTGVFPSRQRPRVYWAGLEAPSTLMTLQARLESEMQELGFEEEENPFRPHLTLARIKEPVGKERMTAALLNFYLEGPSIQVTEISLMRSHLSEEGARYEAIRRFPLTSEFSTASLPRP